MKISRFKSLLHLGVLLIVTLLLSCRNSEKEIASMIEEMKSHEIIVPYHQLLKYEGHHANFDFPNRTGMNLIIYVDESECTPCYLGNIQRWEPFLDLLRSEYQGVKATIILSEPHKEIELFREKLKYTKFRYPIYIDTCNAFARKNPHIPSSRLYHVFLLDKNGKVALVGNPLRNEKVRKLMFGILRKID